MKKKNLSISVLALGLFSTTLAETYTTELQNAYTYAYDIHITTQGSIDSANMYGSLIRSHMAKMMVNYAQNVLGKSPDISLPCIFTDIGNQSAELKGYIIQACQMGLMGVGITAFNPDVLVTRAQFGTVLSRALYDTTYNDGTPYYKYHLQALKEAGIMNNIASPSENEIRGYVMLMMMRAGGKVVEDTTPVCTPENQLLCIVGSSNCPIECQEVVSATAGTITIATLSRDLGMIPSGTKYVGSLKLTATDQDIVLKSLSFQKVGSFTKGWIEDDGVRITTLQSMVSDTTITTSFAANITIKQGTSKILDIGIEGDNGNNQGLVLSSKNGVQSSAATIGGSFPVSMVK